MQKDLLGQDSNEPIGVGAFEISDRAIQYVNNVLKAGRLSYGPYTQKFERLFAAKHECRFAIMTSSGTCALLIALHALKERHGWSDGDEVIVPAVTFVATANVVLQLNLKPIFVDVDPIYYELDPLLLERAITPRTRCIIPVHLFGLPADMGPITEIAERHHLKIIEDSCETMFTKYNGKSVGSLSQIGCFSTYIAHLLTTGVGGICTTNDPDLAIMIRSLMNHGRDSIYLSIDDDKDKTVDEKRLIIQKRFSFIYPGYSFRVTEMEGALGLAEFERHEEMMLKRRANGDYFLENLKNLESEIQLPTIRPNSGHAFMMFPVVLKKEKKARMVEYLEANGIETRDMLPLVNQPIYKRLLGTVEADYPVAKWINESGFYFGCHQELDSVEMQYIVEMVHQYFDRTPKVNKKSALVVMARVDRKEDPLVLESLAHCFRQDLFDEYILADASKNKLVAESFEKNRFQVFHSREDKGSILRRVVEQSKADHFVVIGIDGSDDPNDLKAILLRLKRGADLVVASRFMPGGGRETNRLLSYRSLGNRLFSFLVSILFTKNVTDCNNLLRGFTKQAFLKTTPKRCGDSVMFRMTVDALRQNLRYEECPTRERKSFIPRVKSNRLLMSFIFLGVLIKASFSTPSQENCIEAK